MFLASYVGVRHGYQGLGNVAIQFRLDTIHTHSELIFEPGDGVDDLMPDGTANVSEGGLYWAGSSVFAEKIPDTSPYRPGETGGVRFKRINPYTKDWVCVKLHTDPRKAAQWFVDHQGMKYDYMLIAKYVLWLLPSNKEDRAMCSESTAAACGIPEPERIDPPTMYNLAKFLHEEYERKELELQIKKSL